MRISFWVTPLLFSGVALAQLGGVSVTPSVNQAVLQYVSPSSAACSIQVADMNRTITVTSVAQVSTTVTMQTSGLHGLLTGAVVYVEGSGVWNGWQTITAVPSVMSFSFVSALTGGTSGGNVGVLIDDVNPTLYTGSNLDSRAGNITVSNSRTFVVGHRDAEVATDGNRYSRALQVFSRHHFTLSCGSQTFDQDFTTTNLPLGNTYNEGPGSDRTAPGQYSYPNIQWSNLAQTLIDPVTGIRSVRVTGPQGTTSGVQNFVTALDLQGASWTGKNNPLTNGGTFATFTGPCASGTCPLFVRADNLSLSGGASYNTGSNGVSLDWFQVTVNSASASGTCTTTNCTIDVCLTVDGVTCATPTKETTLSSTPTNITFGTTNLMDLWQASGPPPLSRPDVSQSVGTVNYTASTKKVVFATGQNFSIRWGTGSKINIAGTDYPIASVQSELGLTLSSGPGTDLTGAAYTANNFGVLIWKKTATANTVSLGYTTYAYGSTPIPYWGPGTENPCGPPVIVNGKSGFDCFNGQELFWFSADGTVTTDLGLIQTWFRGGSSPFGTGQVCGYSDQPGQFDPAVDDTWYCVLQIFGDTNRHSIVKMHYNGLHNAQTPGVAIPDCSLNGGAQPCSDITLMMVNVPDDIENTGPPFNPDYAVSGFVIGNVVQGAISPDGTMLVFVNQHGQNSQSWVFMYALGDRTPVGTDSQSLHVVASASTYRKPPATWCGIHNIEDIPEGGWVGISNQEFTSMGALGTYNMTITSATLNTTVGVAGGLNTCPANIFNVVGSVCTAVTVTGQPISALDSSVLQNLQVGDLMTIGAGGTLEYVRVVTITSGTQFTIQRGYFPQNPAAVNSSPTFTMSCGTRNIEFNDYTLWNYTKDPLGTNASLTTVTTDPTQIGGHHYEGGGTYVIAGGYPFNLGTTVCPTVASACLQTRTGNLFTAQFSTVSAVSINPQFAGVTGMGQGNQVDSHPGPCFNFVCTDARPLLGAPDSGLGPTTLGTVGSPFVNTTGQLWKVTGANSIMNRKILPSVAYVGRNVLVDVSGPASVIGSTSSDAFKYCYAWSINECVSGSAVGDVYVNAPYVSYPYCVYPGIAVYADDTNPICIGSLGPYTGTAVQFNTIHHDLSGQYFRRIGNNYARWNMMDVFWTVRQIPSGSSAATQVRWLDNARTDNLNNVLPPMPSPDLYNPRNTFEPITVVLTPPSGLSIASAYIEFGYTENGDPGNYYCTSRQEACAVAVSTINLTTPFYFDQTESFTPLSCVTTCSIDLPALPGRVVYYRWKYLNGGGGLVQTGAAQVSVAH